MEEEDKGRKEEGWEVEEEGGRVEEKDKGRKEKEGSKRGRGEVRKRGDKRWMRQGEPLANFSTQELPYSLKYLTGEFVSHTHC